MGRRTPKASLWARPEDLRLGRRRSGRGGLRFAGTEALTERRDRARAYEREVKLALKPAPKTATSPSAKVLRRQRQQLLEQHVRRLPTKYRELLLHELAGGTIKQYAAMCGLLTRTARKHRKKAIQMVRQALPPAEVESSSTAASQ